MPNKNNQLNQAKKNKKDEFYTQLYDIENELKHYVKHFKNKVVYCNCDDPEYSNFYFFFKEQFNWYGLKKLITTHYEKDSSKQSFKIEITSKEGKLQELKIPLKENGDFRSQECIELLKESDIVVTNPPFSLIKEYINQLIEYNKKFLIIGPLTILGHQDFFTLIKENKVWLGYGFRGGCAHFINNHYEDYAKSGNHKEGMIRVSGIHWYTNLEHSKRNEELILWKTYNSDEFPKYYNYDAINVDKSVEIPKEYSGLIGVPITFLDKHNPKQFELIGLDAANKNFQPKDLPKLEILKDGQPTGKFTSTNKNALYLPYIKSKKPPAFKDTNGNLYQNVYARIIIKNKMLNE